MKENKTQYPDMINDCYYTVDQLLAAEYCDHLLDQDSYMLMRLEDGSLAVIASVDLAHAKGEY